MELEMQIIANQKMSRLNDRAANIIDNVQKALDEEL